MFEQIILVLSWLMWPVLVITLVDDWFLRPRRRIAALPAAAIDPPWLRIAYSLLPVLLIAGAVRLFRSERLDFGLVLVVISVVGGAVWIIDRWLLAPGRARAALAAQRPEAVPEPRTVEHARSMVPVVVVILVLRSFLFEPFRIPSDSMMPTLRDGDFILVNKYSYGLRLPVLNRKFLSVSLPERGDVVVFRYPRDPAVNYIKRVVGLPGDRVKVENDRVYVNGEPLPVTEAGRYSDGCYVNMRLSEVQTGKHRHKVLSCRTPDPLANFLPLPGCDRRIPSSYPCEEDPRLMAQPGVVDRGDEGETVVPAGNYLMIGDNRDNSVDGRYFSADGRTWGFVPEANLVGSAKRVWFNFDWGQRWKKLINWSRIGERID